MRLSVTRAGSVHRAVVHAPTIAYVPEVDAIRALALSLVILFHGGLAPFGWSGVWVFFVVSGFAITTSLMASEMRSGHGPGRILRGFFIRRALRIWPLYYSFVAVNVVVLLVLGIHGPLSDIPYLLTFTYNMKLIFTDYTAANEWIPFGPLWTLSVEEQFYLLFPLAFVFLSRLSLSIGLLLLIAGCPLLRMAWSAWLASRGMPDDRVALGVYAFAPAHFDSFAAGALIALHRDAITQRPHLARRVLGGVCVAIVAYTSYYVWLQASATGGLSVSAFRNIFSGIAYGGGREIWLYSIVWSVSAGLLIAILNGERTVLKLCRSRWLQRLGRISFGSYIFNSSTYMLVGTTISLAALDGLEGAAFKVLRCACAFALIVTAAMISFYQLEKPFLSLRHKFE